MPVVPENFSSSLAPHTQRLLVLGLGVSGFAAAELALRDGFEVWVLDAAAGAVREDRASLLEGRGATVLLDWDGAPALPSASMVVISPGIPPGSLLGQVAERCDCPVLGELEWGYLHCHCPVLAVTGTNGKTTTVEMTSHCLQQAGWSAPVAGNIGVPLSQAARRSASLDCLVVEVSSYQLERVERFTPLASALLNISADHLDRYASLEAYAAAKARLLEQSVASRAVVVRHDLLAHPLVSPHLTALTDRLFTFSTGNSDATLHLAPSGTVRHASPRGSGAKDLFAMDKVRFIGQHNAENAMAALGLCAAVGLPVEQAAHHIETYVPSPHRLETVAQHNGVRVINDSKSTNPDSMARALEAVGNADAPRVLLIAGGLDKDLDFSVVTPVLGALVRQVFLIGSCKHRLASLWDGTVLCRCCPSLESATNAALDAATSGDTVLLSPGCASQDMFANYAERGTVFGNFVRRRLPE